MYIALELVHITSYKSEAGFWNKKTTAMLREVSWVSYFGSVLFTTAIYYGFILYKYYRQDLLEFAKGSQKRLFTKSGSASSDSSPIDSESEIAMKGPDAPKNDIDQLSSVVQVLTDEIQTLTSEARNDSLSRERIYQSIQFIVRKYSSIDLSAFKEPIKELIAQQCATNCSVHLSEEELDGLWV